MAHLDAQAEACGYANYTATHLTYPPNGLLPLPGNSTRGPRGCDLWDEIFDAALLVNPAFNIYRIYDTVSSDAQLPCYFLTYAGAVPNPLGCPRISVCIVPRLYK